MKLDEEGHAMMEMLMIVPLIVIVLMIVTVTGELFYVDNRTILASKCLILHEYNMYYETLRQNRGRGGAATQQYAGSDDLKAIFFPRRDAEFIVIAEHNVGMGRDDEGVEHIQMEQPGALDSDTWGVMVGMVNKARGKTRAAVHVQFAPTLFWPESYSTLRDTVYLAAADWRYDEVPGGYTDWLKRKLGVIPGVGRILEWLD
jgi:hypothetical protein